MLGVFDINGNSLTREKIRVCTFNVGNFALGQSGRPVGTDELYNKFVNTFRKCNADIYMFEEWDPRWNATETSENVLGFLKPYHSTYVKPDSGDGYMGLMNYSAFEFKGEHYQYFTSLDTGRYFIDNPISINGKTIHIICTHLTLTSRAEALAEIQQILDYITANNITSYIIGGDMNLGIHREDDIPHTDETARQIQLEEIALLESLGGKSAQGSGWGLKHKDYLFNTVLHGGYEQTPTGGFGPYDNIVVSPDIKISNVESIITDASDHDPLCVDLII